jgi:putative ABC transport system permease protein
MLFGEIINVALGALRANKLRSLLTMLGIVIGVSAVIAMIALGRGASKAVNDRIAALGTTLLTVMPGQQFNRGVGSEMDRARLTMRDATALEERSTYIAAVQPEMNRNLQVQFGSRNTNTQIRGVTSNYLEVRNYKVLTGRMFTTAEDNNKERVAVLGPQTVQDLNIPDPEAVVGENVRIRGIQFRVVGVLQAKGQGAGFGGNPDSYVLVPIQTARYRILGTDRLNNISVLAPNDSSVPLTMADIQKILRREHKLRGGRPDDFQIRNQSDFLNTVAETTAVFGLLLAGIAAVSLLVGGIGIMNIMLVSVTERTREIGVRKALGATRWNILMQFLIEAVVLCLMGGLVGVMLGAGAARFLAVKFSWNTQIAPESIALAFGFSATVGLLFGVWPARRAARMDPVIALRYE